jgi:hypothetical protein
MLLVSYLIVGMSTLFDFTPEEHKAYEKVKKLIATDQARQKAANVIKTIFRIAKHRKSKLHRRFVYYLLLKQHLALFKNENKVAHSRLLPSDQMVKNLEEKLRNDLNEMRDKAYWIMGVEERCQRIRSSRERAEKWVQLLRQN